MENPFGDSIAPTGEPTGSRQQYLVLISAGKDNAALAQRILKNIQEAVDPTAAPLWIDAKGIGVFVSTELVAWEIRAAALPSKDADQLTDVRDILVLEIGKDWAARKDAKTEHWLSTHVGEPKAAPVRRKPRR